jgi:hypothetical protein
LKKRSWSLTVSISCDLKCYLRVHLNEWTELLILNEAQIGRQHHQFAGGILVLKRTVPLLRGPFQVD